MESLTKLISALAQILWPALGFTTLLVFKNEISDILKRIKKGKMLGQEIELSDSLEALRASAETVKETAAKLPLSDPEPVTIILENTEQDEIKQVLDEASRSPRVALITLSGHIEVAARRALASLGRMDITRRYFSPVEAIKEINERSGALPAHVVESMKLFMDIRNKLVHMREASEEDIISALDSGITILRTLKAIPMSTYTVLHTDIPLFQDSECTNMTGGLGVILEAISPGGVKKTKLIFPTLRDWFKKGQNVSWDWDLQNIWQETWYVDPETGEKKQGWSSSGEFVGRSLDHVNGA
ncbi:hypothetical protein I5Q49_08070 [Pseudomonas carnis]|uniref:hypothetical protein n=1 Tax=Pseudomonas carnis TaxID=2487355 RepID=UPI0018DA0EDA|nr:hypothetical protein [Pseudomonas carnis]MBH3464801.1 hypothetical protein [Pseudomonas carnis]